MSYTFRVSGGFIGGGGGKKDLRGYLNDKRVRQHFNRNAKLAGSKKPLAKKKEKFDNYGHLLGVLPKYTYTFPNYVYTEAEMTAVKDKLKDTEEKLAASQDEIAGLRKRLEEAESRANFAEAELEEFKHVAAFFLADFVTDVDNIMPDDLEYGLREFEKEFEVRYSNDITNASWSLILQLCKKLGMSHTNGYTELQNVKVFIKELARSNHLLEKNNIDLAKKLEDTDNTVLDLIDSITKIHERRRR